MTSLARSFKAETHQDFICDLLLPAIVGYARSNGHPAEAVALASFMSLATVLEAKGITRDVLLQAIDASTGEGQQAGETLQ